MLLGSIGKGEWFLPPQAHNRCMRKFILYAFDMAREIQITPRRISYAREKEAELYESLMDIASRKQDEIRNVIADTVANLKEDLLDKAAAYEFKGLDCYCCCSSRVSDIYTCVCVCISVCCIVWASLCGIISLLYR